MKKQWKLLLGVLGLGLLATMSFGQTYGNWGQKNQPTQSATSPQVPAVRVDVVGGVNPSDTSFVPLQFNSSGYLKSAEQSSNRDANLTFSNIISNASVSAGAADSSSVLDTHAMRLGTLLIKCTPISITGADSLSGIRLAIQVRTHLAGASDSNSTFAFYPYGRSDMFANAAAASQIDTLLTGQIQIGVNLQANVNTAYSGEFTCLVAYNRVGPGSSVIGSLGQRTYFYPNGIAIPLSSIFGRDIYSPYTSIRVRNLGSGPSTARACALTVHLVGTPL